MNRSGEDVLAFVDAAGLVVPTGKGAGGPLVLRDWQRQLIRDTVDSGARRAYWQMPRKNSKSALASVLGLYGLIADREPGALVVSAAADREQARIIFAFARRLIETSPSLSQRIRVYRNEFVVPSSDSRWRVLSSDAHTKEGLNVSLALIDELHAHPSRDLYDVLSLSMGARENPLVLVTTTPGARYDRFGRDTACYQLWDYGRRIQAGEVDDRDFFFREFAAAADCDPDDREQWFKANPALDDFLHLRDMEAARKVTPENEFKTKRLGLWVTASEAWLPHGSWEKCAKPEEVAEGSPIVLALDGSFSGDSTALIGATVEPNPYVFVAGLWEKTPRDPESWRVDIEDVEAAVLAACARWKVAEVSFDPYRWQRSMAVLQSQRVPVMEYPQTNTRMIPAAQRLFEAVAECRLRHDGDARLARHVGNTYTKATPLGPKPVKDHKDSQRRIDAAIAAVMAYDRADTLGNAPGRPPLVVL